MTEVGRDFRKTIGFTNAQVAKDFFRAKDLDRPINYVYIETLNSRLSEIVDLFAQVVPQRNQSHRPNDFKTLFVESPYKTLFDAGLIPKMNNLGRNPEEVYFSWMRGYIVANFFQKSIAALFEVEEAAVEIIGDDNLADINNFSKTPKADLEIPARNGLPAVRVEMQSGFTGVNQVKFHKVAESREVFRSNGAETIAAHFDFFNGKVAIVPLSTITDDDPNWTTSQQMEGQKVLNISDRYFVWNLQDEPPKWTSIRTELI